MDIQLTQNSVAICYGADQVRQDITLILRNRVGSWLQSYRIGSYVDLHVQSSLLEEGVRKTLEELPYVTTKSVKVTGDNIRVEVSYQGDSIALNLNTDGSWS